VRRPRSRGRVLLDPIVEVDCDGAAKELDRPVGAPTGPATGAIHPLARHDLM
jgi:hypothetical protein